MQKQPSKSERPAVKHTPAPKKRKEEYMKKTDLAYLAGILDGEGCIHIGKWIGQEGQLPRYRLAVQISMVDKVPLLLARFAFGGYLRLRKRKNDKWKPLWEWGVGSGSAVECLKDLMPYLHTKKAEAELAIKFQESKNHKQNWVRREDKVLAVEEANYILMKSLKDKSCS